MRWASSTNGRKVLPTFGDWSGIISTSRTHLWSQLAVTGENTLSVDIRGSRRHITREESGLTASWMLIAYIEWRDILALETSIDHGKLLRGDFEIVLGDALSGDQMPCIVSHSHLRIDI